MDLKIIDERELLLYQSETLEPQRFEYVEFCRILSILGLETMMDTFEPYLVPASSQAGYFVFSFLFSFDLNIISLKKKLRQTHCYFNMLYYYFVWSPILACGLL